MLGNPHNLLIDRKTKGSDYGAMDGESFGDSEVKNEVVVEIWDKQFRIVGHYAMGAGLAANGSVVVSSEGYGRFFPGDTVNNVNYGLVELKPGIDPADFSRRLNHQLTLDKDSMQPTAPVLARTRDEVEKQESRRWLLGTPIGAIFIAGVVVALVVGTVIVYMVLSNDVANHLREYATLKAMGYTDGFLSSVVMQQAIGDGGVGVRRILGHCRGTVSRCRLVGQFAHGDELAHSSARLCLDDLHVLHFRSGHGEKTAQRGSCRPVLAALLDDNMTGFGAHRWLGRT